MAARWVPQWKLRRERLEFHRMVRNLPDLEIVELKRRIAFLRQTLDDIALGAGNRRTAFEALRQDEAPSGDTP